MEVEEILKVEKLCDSIMEEEEPTQEGDIREHINLVFISYVKVHQRFMKSEAPLNVTLYHRRQ